MRKRTKRKKEKEKWKKQSRARPYIHRRLGCPKELSYTPHHAAIGVQGANLQRRQSRPKTITSKPRTELQQVFVVKLASLDEFPFIALSCDLIFRS